MSGLLKQITILENSISYLLRSRQKLEEENSRLSARLEQSMVQNNEIMNSLNEAHKRIDHLKTANALLGSDSYKTETKLKINALIKEIDQCITHLT